MFKHIINQKIDMRLLEIRQAEQLFLLVESNREHLRRWLPWLDNTKSVEEIKSFIKRSLEKFSSDNGCHAGIWYEDNLAGVIGIHEINWPNKCASFGYWLGEKFQGKGIMTRACEALINHSFSDLGLNRIEIRCAEENFKSKAIPERLGFTKEGIIRDAEWLYDHYLNYVVYGLLAREWNLSETIKPDSP